MNSSEPKPTRTTDPDLLGAEAALVRAAKVALDLALATGTPCYIWRDGRVVDLAAEIRVGSSKPLEP